MTVIACKIYDNGYVIGADSQTTTGDISMIDSYKHTKLIDINSMVITSTGYSREIGLMELFSVNHKPQSEAIRDVLEFYSEYAQYVKKTTDFTVRTENLFYLGLDTKVFIIHNYFIKEIDKYDAAGIGGDIARTALHLGHDVKESIDIACKLSVYCSGPAVIADKRR